MTEPGKTLITGASGFIGRHLLRTMHQLNLPVRAHCRTPQNNLNLYTNDIVTGTIEDALTKGDLLSGISFVVHLASRVHQMNEKPGNLLQEYRKTNRDLTLALARASLTVPVKKFIFVSTVKVVGDSCQADDPYGISKLEAEQELDNLFSQQSFTQCIILRLPLVYGPYNKGNMLSLLRTASLGLPLPLGAAKGRRSMIYVKNVCDAIIKILTNETPDRSAVKTYFLTDGKDLTSAELYSMIFKAYKKKNGIFAIPEGLIRHGGAWGSQLEKLCGLRFPINKEVVSRLFDEYCFSSSAFCQDYGWQPPYTPEQGIKQTVEWHKFPTNN